MDKEVACKECDGYFELYTDDPDAEFIHGECPFCGCEDEHEVVAQ